MNEIFQEQRKYFKEYRAKVNEITNCLNSRNIDPHLQRRAMKYIECYYKTGIESKNKLENSLDCLSKYLKEEILKDANFKILKKINFLNQYFSN